MDNAEQRAVTYSDLTPNTVQSRQTLVTFNTSVAAVTLCGRVTLDPHMLHSLKRHRNYFK